MGISKATAVYIGRFFASKRLSYIPVSGKGPGRGGFAPSPLPFIPLSSVRAAIWSDEGQLSSRCPTKLHRLHPRHPVRHRAPHRCPFLDPLQSNFERPAA